MKKSAPPIVDFSGWKVASRFVWRFLMPSLRTNSRSLSRKYNSKYESLLSIVWSKFSTKLINKCFTQKVEPQVAEKNIEVAAGGSIQLLDKEHPEITPDLAISDPPRPSSSHHQLSSPLPPRWITCEWLSECFLNPNRMAGLSEGSCLVGA